MEKAGYKSGFVTLIGRPNVGKSTLMNHLIGQKIAITSNKPQTTRNRIQTVYTSEEGQIIFLDTPGIHKAKNKLGEYMVTAAEQTLKEVDVVLWLVEPTDYIGRGELHIAQMLKNTHLPVILIMNKMDTVNKNDIPRFLDAYREIFDFDEMIPVCALRGLHMDQVIRAIFHYLPYGPKYYDDDTVTDQPQRQIVAELIREKVLRCMEAEIPHGIAVSIDTMQERSAGSQRRRNSRAAAALRQGGSGGSQNRSGRELKTQQQDGSGSRQNRQDRDSKTQQLQADPGNRRNQPDNGTSVLASQAAPGSRRMQAESQLRADSEWIMDIEATIICEKESHKGMIIGKQGAMLRKIGSQARYEMEQMLEEPVNLQLWVKVKKDWRDSDFMIKNFGYDRKELE
ncbi:MAG: GTPase Era [Lachnospiraceae bacterium]|nr:GTPase Era [Lachnospiraceae bacterium]